MWAHKEMFRATVQVGVNNWKRPEWRNLIVCLYRGAVGHYEKQSARVKGIIISVECKPRDFKKQGVGQMPFIKLKGKTHKVGKSKNI